MAIFSEVNALKPEKVDPDLKDKPKLRIYFGVFFDGTNNNMIQRAKAIKMRNEKADGLFNLDNRHKYEEVEILEDDAKDIDKQKDDGYYKKGKEIKGFSNIAIMHSKYQGVSDEELGKEGYVTRAYKIYVEGSGANDIDKDVLWKGTSGFAISGLGFGLGKTGVVSLASKAVVAVHSILSCYGGYDTVELHFDVFGFSRGATSARLFAYLVRRGKKEKLDVREYEFGKFSAKAYYKENEKRLSFLDDYAYGEPADGKKTKKVDFLGIFDTVASIGLLRRKKMETDVGVEDVRQIIAHKVVSFISDMDVEGIRKNMNSIRSMVWKQLGMEDEGELLISIENKSIVLAADLAHKILNEILEIVQKNLRKIIGTGGPEDNHFLKGDNIINPLRLGMSLNKDFWGNLHDLNAKEYGLYSPSLGIKTLHICAMDEFRENFALVDIGKNVPPDCLEVFLPGCHSDLGGGYVCGDETRSVINKYASFFAADTEKVYKKEKLSMIVENPQNKQKCKCTLANLETLKILGWIPVAEGDKEKSWSSHQFAHETLADDGQNVQGTHGMTDRLEATMKGNFTKYDEVKKVKVAKAEFEFWEDNKRVGFKRVTPSFFSNLPLRLMVERAKQETKRELFKKELDIGGGKNDTSFYNIPEGLQEFYDAVRSKAMSEYQKKLFFFPGDGYSTEAYRKFRINYLHFTSEQNWGYSRMWNVPNAIDHVMSRIVYHGGNTEEDDHKMHYMHDYNQDCVHLNN
ncbi:MAG: DUF2235 domain-containing protein [Prevotella sp.]|nr:DUF2235 domain-containing protein [Prevotella sp.]